MKKFDIKSLILGIGIGMILTSILGLVYSTGYLPDEKNFQKYNNTINNTYSTANNYIGSTNQNNTEAASN